MGEEGRVVLEDLTPYESSVLPGGGRMNALQTPCPTQLGTALRIERVFSDETASDRMV